MEWQKFQSAFKSDLINKSNGTLTCFETRNYSGLSIYQDAFSIRIREYLEADFPETLSRLSAPQREFLIREYSAEHTAIENAADFGENFANFLAAALLPAELNYLPDLARVEWAMVQAFYAPEAPKINADFLGKLSEVGLFTARFLFHPSLYFLRSPWPLVEIYEGLAMPSRGEPLDFIVYSDNGETTIQVLGLEEAKLLRGLYLGRNLAHFANLNISLEAEVFSEWVRSGLLSGIEIGYETSYS